MGCFKGGRYTACLHIDGNDLVEKKIFDEKDREGNYWSDVLEQVKRHGVKKTVSLRTCM